MTLTYTRDDSVSPALQPTDRGYYVKDAQGRVRGVVAGSGRSWYAGPVSPSRSRIPSWTVRGETRAAAAERMLRGRP
jgi:hypothetical protein